jgi:hypothetical protein
MRASTLAQTVRRVAFFIGSLSVALAILGTARVAGVFRHNHASQAEMASLFAWAVLPLAMTVGGMLTTLGESVALVWSCVGALCGFVVLAAWSLGPFYGFAALALLLAALVHLAAVRPRWKVVLAPVWLLTGASSVDVVILIRDWSQESATHHIIEAPAVIWGGWLFAACAASLVVTYSVSPRARR